MASNIIEILKYLKSSAIKTKKSSRIDLLTSTLSNKVPIQQGDYNSTDLTVFKPSMFSFLFLPPPIHIILKYISNKYVFTKWCVQY